MRWIVSVVLTMLLGGVNQAYAQCEQQLAEYDACILSSMCEGTGPTVGSLELDANCMPKFQGQVEPLSAGEQFQCRLNMFIDPTLPKDTVVLIHAIRSTVHHATGDRTSEILKNPPVKLVYAQGLNFGFPLVSDTTSHVVDTQDVQAGSTLAATLSVVTDSGTFTATDTVSIKDSQTTLTYECADNCGGKAPSGCWCDSACAKYGDCCDMVCSDCSMLPQCGP